MEKFEMLEICENDFKGIREMEAYARDVIMPAVMEAITEKFGEESVSITGDTTIAVGFADVTLDKPETEGDRTFHRTEWCFELPLVLKKYKKTVSAKRSIDRYDRFNEEEAYNKKVAERKEKEQKKNEKSE